MVIRDDNYGDAFVLEMMTIQEAYNQNRILNHINKLICFEEGNIRGLMAINESMADSIKNFLKRIVDFIKKTFGNFKERIAELVTTDKKFFEKYKDVIVKNPFKKHMLNDWYEYNTEKFNEIHVPVFDFNKIQNHMTEDKEYNEETFIDDYLKKEHDTVKSRIGSNDKIDNVKELIEFSIRGDETKDDVDMSLLKKDKIIKFVQGIEATQKVLENDQNTLMSNQSKIESIVMKKLKDIKDTNDKAETTSADTDDKDEEEEKPKTGATGDTGGQGGNAGSGQNGSGQGQGEGEQGGSGPKPTGGDAAIDIFSPMSSILEFKENKSAGKDSSSIGSTANTAKSAVKKDVNKVNGQDVQNKVDAIGSTVDASGNPSQNSISNQEADRMEEATTQFFKSCSEILTTKLNMAMACYKDYMKILRIHVRDYVGEENGNDNTSGTKENEEHQSLNIAGAKLPTVQKKKADYSATATHKDTINVTVKYLGDDAVDKFEDKIRTLGNTVLPEDNKDMFGAAAILKYYGTGAGAAYRDGKPMVVVYNGGNKGYSAAIKISDDGSTSTTYVARKKGNNPF